MGKSAFFVLALLLGATALADGQLRSLPDPALDAPLAKGPARQTAVLAGGCFWGMQLVFQHVKGVLSATAGYAGGQADSARYETVSTGTTGHAESVQVVYDPSRISYGRLLKIYFAVAHDPTELNRQGPDQGKQYRSEIFTMDADQRSIARAYIRQLDAAQIYPKKIVTEVGELPDFYPAEKYHQDYATLHPYDMYIYINDRPKLRHLKEQFPEWYKK